MNWAFLIDLVRLALAAVGLLLVGRLLGTARIYLSWRAFACYGAAWVLFTVVCFLRLSPFGFAENLALSLAFETLLLLAVGGSLLEHVRADRRRHRDSRRLMQQWQHASGLSRQRANELEVLAAVTAQLVASLDLRQVLQALVEHTLRLSGADSVIFYLVDRETGRLRGQGVMAVAGQQRAADRPAPRAHGLTAAVVGTAEPAFISDVAQHPLFQDVPRPHLCALASVPLRYNGAVAGVLNVSYRRPHAFDDDQQRLLLALADIAALAIHNATQHERLARLAVTDELTGLPNRRRFLEVLRAEAQRARRYQRPLSVLMLDLDGLKDVNDRHGHAAGDAVLRGAAQALRAHTRDTDLPARLSGDEFAVLLPETEPDAALRIAERIRASVAAFQAPVEGVPPGGLASASVTVSVGLASAEGAALRELPRFLRLADEALYQAKAAGRNAIAVAASPSAAASPALPQPANIARLPQA